MHVFSSFALFLRNKYDRKRNSSCFHSMPRCLKLPGLVQGQSRPGNSVFVFHVGAGFKFVGFSWKLKLGCAASNQTQIFWFKIRAPELVFEFLEKKSLPTSHNLGYFTNLKAEKNLLEASIFKNSILDCLPVIITIIIGHWCLMSLQVAYCPWKKWCTLSTNIFPLESYENKCLDFSSLG